MKLRWYHCWCIWCCGFIAARYWTHFDVRAAIACAIVSGAFWLYEFVRDWRQNEREVYQLMAQMGEQYPQYDWPRRKKAE